MLINKRQHFVFVKVPRTAGTSMQIALKRHSRKKGCIANSLRLGKEDKMRDYVEATAHYSVEQIYERYFKDKPYRFKNYFKFCFVRNPFTRVLSAFYSYKNQDEILALIPDPWTVSNVQPVFKRWLFAHAHFNAYDFGTLNREYCLDFVGRFENLTEDYNHACDQIGMPRHELPKKHTDKKKLDVHYSALYDVASRDYVAKRCAQDLAVFGYEFEPLAW